MQRRHREHDFWPGSAWVRVGNVITLHKPIRSDRRSAATLESPSMKLAPLALSLAVALCATAAPRAHADGVTPVTAPAATDGAATDDGAAAARNRPAPKVHELGAISVSAALDQARNALSPDTGSSQYVIDQKAIAQLPLGASTPVNQVILQAPGVVQDSYGGLHVRGDHANLQYRINGVIVPE